MTSTDHPRVIAPPPLLYLVALVAIVLLHWYWPITLLPAALAAWLAIVMVVLGLAMNIWGAYTMRQARTAINPYRPASTIVDTGPFRFSRNPLYVGADLFLLGLASWLNSLWGIPVFVLVLIAVHYGVILREERYLEGQFGEAYRQYRQRVRRYI